MFDIGSGLSALFGAAVGGGVTYAVTWLGIKFQSKQAKHDYVNALAAQRRETHQQVIKHLFLYIERARSTVELRNKNRDLDDAVHRYTLAWDDVHVSMGVALMEGPNILSDKLFELMTTTIEYANLVENYVNGGAKSNNLGRVEDQMHDQKLAYIDLARKQLSLD